MSKKPLCDLNIRRTRARLSVLQNNHNVQIADPLQNNPRDLLANEININEIRRQQVSSEISNNHQQPIIVVTEIPQPRMELENLIDVTEPARTENCNDEQQEYDENAPIDYNEESDVDDGNSTEDENDEYNASFPDMNDDDMNEQPLYQGAGISVMESMLLILTLLINHNVTMSCLSDIITIINFHCLREGLKKNSLFKFRKYFSMNERNDMIKHYYCSKCMRHLISGNDKCPSCPNSKISYFVQMSFLNQLKEMYKRNNFYNSLQHRFNRLIYPPGTFSDIYNGSLYETWSENGFLLNPNNISLSWYTDGIPVFKSSKISMWPIYLTINELPFEIRKKRENVLLAGLWYGETKPDMNRFIYSMRPDLQRLFNGIEVNIPNNNISITVKGVLLSGTCDTPARCECLNFVNYNSPYGCAFCLCKGETVFIESGGHVHAFPYSNQIIMRTAEDTEKLTNEAKLNEPEKGVKGTSSFSKLMPDFIKGMGIDRMHCVEGGVLKKMLNLLFSVEWRTQRFSLYEFIDVINNRLLSIKPPKYVHRMLRSISDLLHWKASELKIWFFYYSIPIFQGILRPDYFDHYILLVTATAMLSSDVITPRMIEISRDLLHKFVRDFEMLYDIRFCSINIHLLLHLPDIVQRLGPLWVFTCFEYESLNGELLKLIHGTNHIDTQIANSHNQLITMKKFIEKLPADNEIAISCQKKKKQVKIIERILEKCYSVGTYRKIRVFDGIIGYVIKSFQIFRNFEVWQFSRLLKDQQLYVGKIYKDNLQTNSSTVQFMQNDGFGLGIIHSFLKIRNCNCPEQPCECEDIFLAIIVQQLICTETVCAQGDNHSYSSREFLQKCDVVDNVFCVAVEDLVTVCIYMNINNSVYVGMPVNRKEIE